MVYGMQDSTKAYPAGVRLLAKSDGHSIELTIILFLLMAIAVFGMKTMVSGFLMQNWSIGQSMTDAYAGIETAYAQREVFANIPHRRTLGNLPCSRHHTG